MIKRILVALSGTPFTGASIAHAVELGRAHGAELTGVTDVDLVRLADVGPVPVGASAAAQDLIEQRLELTQRHIEESIGAFESACREAGLAHSVARETADPFDAIVSLWRYHDLSVAGLRGLFEYGVVHHPDDTLCRLIARGVRPLLAVARTARPVRRVLVAYNGSMESAKAMKRFVQMRIWPEVAIKIVCFELKAAEARALLADASGYCAAHGHRVQVEHVPGHPRELLLEHASGWGADLIVMGTTSRARILRHLLGDTALHALRHAEVPLFMSQ